MESKLFNSEQYLTKIETINFELEEGKKILASFKEFCEPLQDVDYGNSGEVRIERGDESIEFSYESLDSEMKSVLQDYFVKSGDKDYIAERLDTSRWRQLKEYGINETSKSTVLLDIIKLVPDDYKILFYPQKEFVNACAINSPDHKLILLVGDMSALVVPLVLLHEIGHVQDNMNLSRVGLDKLVTDSSYALEAEKLRKERTATSFALKVLRPLFGKSEFIDKQAVINFLKSFALNTYHNSIESLLSVKGFYGGFSSSKLARDFARDFESDLEVGEEMGRQMEEGREASKVEFEEWKKTPGYIEWKKLERNMDDSREFDNWERERNLSGYFERWKTENFRMQTEKYGNQVTFDEWKDREENKTLSGYEEFYKWLVIYETKDYTFS